MVEGSDDNGLTPEEIRDLADTVRSEGFDRVAEWLEENAHKVEEEENDPAPDPEPEWTDDGGIRWG